MLVTALGGAVFETPALFKDITDRPNFSSKPGDLCSKPVGVDQSPNIVLIDVVQMSAVPEGSWVELFCSPPKGRRRLEKLAACPRSRKP